MEKLNGCKFHHIHGDGVLSLYATCLGKYDESPIRLVVLTLKNLGNQQSLTVPEILAVGIPHETQFCDMFLTRTEVYNFTDECRNLTIDSYATIATENIKALQGKISKVQDTKMSTNNYVPIISDNLLILLRKPRNHKYLLSVTQSSNGYKPTGNVNEAIREWNTRIFAKHIYDSL